MNTHEFMNWLEKEIRQVQKRIDATRSQQELYYLEGRLYSLLDCRHEIIVSQFTSPTQRS